MASNRHEEIESSLSFLTLPTAGLGFEFEVNANRYSSLIIGGSYNFERVYDSYKIELSDRNDTVEFSDPLSLSYGLIYFNITSHLSDDVFIFGGVNYSFPEFSSGEFQDFTLSEGLGYQWGIGIYSMEDLSINIMYECVDFEAEYTFTSSSRHEEIKKATENDVKILTKIHF